MISKAEACSLARSSGWLSKQPLEFQDALLSRCQVRHYAADQVICNVGDRYNGMIGLVAGVMRIEFATAGQDLRTASAKQSNFWFGQASSFTRRNHSVTVTASTAATILHLTYDKFEELIENAEYCKCLALLTIEHYYEAATALAHLLSGTVEQRVASRLVLLAERTDRKPPIVISVTQSELAEMCSLGRLTANQAVGKLVERGLISIGYRRIAIENIDRLISFCAEAL